MSRIIPTKSEIKGNKEERKAFLRDYKSWRHTLISNLHLGVAPEIAIVALKNYYHEFKNGAVVVATELLPVPPNGKDRFSHYNLILPESELGTYDPFDKHSYRSGDEFRSYDLVGQSISVLIDYMAKQRDVI